MSEFQKASVCIIGTELTRGVICDKHASLIGSQLSRLGYTVEGIVIIPDDGTIRTVLGEIVHESDVVLVTGGLGPTSDDMTRNAIAALAGVPLKRDSQVYEWLAKKVGDRIHGANEIQTMFPEGFIPIDNPNGTAPGFYGMLKDGERDVVCVAMPGPPREMDPMFLNHVLPYLATLRGHVDGGRDEYSVYLVSEAKLEELCEQVALEGVAWGTRFQDFRISLYVTGPVLQRKEFISALRQLAGKGLIVDGDLESVDSLEDVLKEGGCTISTAESCTGGLLGKLLTDRAGSSTWFWGSAVTYANEAKETLLGVSRQVLDGVGPVSRECALMMADGIRKRSGTDVSLSTTGYAGPSGDEVGCVWFGFSGKGKESQAVCLHLTALSRSSIRRRAAVASFILAREFMAGGSLLDMSASWNYI